MFAGIFPPVASHSTFLLLATASSGPGWTEGPHDQGSGLRGTGYYQEDGVQCHDMLRHEQALCKTPRGLNVLLVLLEYWRRLCEGMAGMRQAWSSFSMAPRQKYGQDRGHVTSAGPMGGQHCRGLGQSQPSVTGTWVCRAA